MFNYARKFNKWYDNKLQEPYRFLLFMAMVIVPISLTAINDAVYVMIGFVLLLFMLTLRMIK